MSLNMFKSTEEIPLNGNISNKVEKKRSYLIGLLIGTLAFTTGVAIYHGSGSSVSPLSRLVHEQSDTPSSGFMSADELNELVDDQLGKMGLTLADVAPVMKAQIDAQEDVLIAYEMMNPDVLSFSFSPSSACRNPLIDWNFGFARIYICLNIGGSGVAVNAFIRVLDIDIWSIEANLGECGGQFDIPGIGIPPVGPNIEGTIYVELCKSRSLRVCLRACFAIFCQDLGCQSVGLP